MKQNMKMQAGGFPLLIIAATGLMLAGGLGLTSAYAGVGTPYTAKNADATSTVYTPTEAITGPGAKIISTADSGKIYYVTGSIDRITIEDDG